MNIFTSSFYRARGLDPNRFFVVSISRFPPRRFEGFCSYELAPSVGLLHDYKSGLSWGDYICRYRREVLERVDVYSVFKILASLSGGRDIVLCCYESTYNHCHRHLVADYVKEVWGYSIEEII